ncbi:MAG: sugar transferase [Calditrichia bacterium]
MQTADSFYIRYGKRLFDLIAGSVGLLVLLPFFLLIGLAIKLSDGGPIFFRQPRIGKNFRKFYFFKFRTMIPNAERKGPPITESNDPRITPVGRLLRRYKLDELPQLINVVKGDISLVGPRPELERYVQIFRNDFREILTVKPGITDFATLEFHDEDRIFRKYSDVDEGYQKEVLPQKITLYKQYLSRISFWTDLKIIFKTLWRIIS